MPSLLLVWALCLSGCAPRFHYSPRHDAAYGPPTPFRGVQIERGDTDNSSRADGVISWSQSDARIVAEALADELKYSGLFEAAKVVRKADTSRSSSRFSHIVRFEIYKFHVRPDDNFGQKAGRAALKYMGPRGYFLGKGIPRKWVAEVEIEFSLHDARGSERIFSKVYRATPRSVSANGYSGTKEQERQFSLALEEVVKAFARDLARRAGGPPRN
ncbi:MAG: hypothetical protein QOF48_3035 [Verrucomicrobiota bacterium]|jgi:hypothetical protein